MAGERTMAPVARRAKRGASGPKPRPSESRALLTDIPSGGPDKAGKGGALFASLSKSVPPAVVIASRSGQDR